MSLARTAEGLLFSIGVLLIMLIALYGVASLIIRFSPQPVSGWLSKLVSYSTPAGWSMSASGSSAAGLTNS
jgi:hypothetical protein